MRLGIWLGPNVLTARTWFGIVRIPRVDLRSCVAVPYVTYLGDGFGTSLLWELELHHKSFEETLLRGTLAPRGTALRQREIINVFTAQGWEPAREMIRSGAWRRLPSDSRASRGNHR